MAKKDEESEAGLGDVAEALERLDDTLDRASLGLIATWLEELKSSVNSVARGLSEIHNELKELNKNLSKLAAQAKK